MNKQDRRETSVQELKERLRPAMVAQFHACHRRRVLSQRVRRSGAAVAIVGCVLAAIWWNPFLQQPGPSQAGRGDVAVAGGGQPGGQNDAGGADHPGAVRYSSMTVEFLSDAAVEKLLAEQNSDWIIAKVNGEIRAFHIARKN